MRRKSVLKLIFVAHVLTSLQPLWASGSSSRSDPGFEEFRRTSAARTRTPGTRAAPTGDAAAATSADLRRTLSLDIAWVGKERDKKAPYGIPFHHISAFWEQQGRKPTGLAGARDMLFAIAENSQEDLDRYHTAIDLLWYSFQPFEDKDRDRLYSHMINIYHRETDPDKRWALLDQLWYHQEAQEAVHPLLVEIGRRTGDPRQWLAIDKILHDSSYQGRERAFEDLQDTFFAFACDKQDPSHQWEAIMRLICYDGKNKQAIRERLRPILMTMVHNVDHKHHAGAVLGLCGFRQSREESPPEELMAPLMAIAQKEGPSQWSAFWVLWDLALTSKPDLRDPLLPVAHFFARQESPHTKQHAIEGLWRFGRDPHVSGLNEFFPELHTIAQTSRHEFQQKALEILWLATGPQQAENRTRILPALQDFVLHHYTPPLYGKPNTQGWQLLKKLWEANEEQPAGRFALLEIVREIARTNTYDYQWQAMELLWTLHQEHPEVSLEEFTETLVQTFQDPNATYQWRAFTMLWFMEGEGQKARRTDILTGLTASLRAEGREGFWQAFEHLWEMRPNGYGGPHRSYSAEQLLQNKQELLPLLKEIAADDGHPLQNDALETLWYERLNREFFRAEARPILVALAQNEASPSQELTIRLLRESDDPADQQLGLRLHLQYFPLSYTAELRAKIQLFNQKTFLDNARPPLPSLRQQEMNLPQEFEALMAQINPVNPEDPGFLQMVVITGENADQDRSLEENERKFQAIRGEALGFLRVLVGQPLQPGEVCYWQMHEEDKPAFINTLKHLVNALKAQEDLTIRLNNLGIVLNGLRYCQSGKVEGLNSAVNSLIYGHNRVAGSFEDIMHTLIQEAVYQTFLNTFHHGGGVHNLSRVRLVLGAHIGLPQAVAGFEERIYPISNDEIPQILDTFYTGFPPAFLRDYLGRHLQTPEEAERVAAAAVATGETKERLKQQNALAKRERPLLHGEILGWLINQGMQDRLANFGFSVDGSGGLLNPDGMTEILKMLGYVSR